VGSTPYQCPRRRPPPTNHQRVCRRLGWLCLAAAATQQRRARRRTATAAPYYRLQLWPAAAAHQVECGGRRGGPISMVAVAADQAQARFPLPGAAVLGGGGRHPTKARAMALLGGRRSSCSKTAATASYKRPRRRRPPTNHTLGCRRQAQGCSAAAVAHQGPVGPPPRRTRILGGGRRWPTTGSFSAVGCVGARRRPPPNNGVRYGISLRPPHVIVDRGGRRVRDGHLCVLDRAWRRPLHIKVVCGGRPGVRESMTAAAADQPQTVLLLPSEVVLGGGRPST